MSTIGKVLLGLVLGSAGVYAIGKKMSRSAKPVKEAVEKPKEPVLPGTELTMRSIVYVTLGEEKVFRNRKIMFNAPIICDGGLIFENCELLYHPGQPTSIILKKDAALTLRNCKVICDLSDEKAVKRVYSTGPRFVQVESKAAVSCTETEFVNCINFLHAGDKSTVVFESCRLIDPACFCEYDRNARLDVKGSAIRFSKTSGEADGIFTSFGDGNIARISNCSIEGPHERMFCQGFPVFMIHDAEIEDCRFSGVNSCIKWARTVTRCEFRQCNDLIRFYTRFIKGEYRISDCLFVDCENVISALPRQSTVEKCRFVRCKENLINNCGLCDEEPKGHGKDIIVDSCEFISSTGHDCHFGTSLAFIRSVDGDASIVRNCLFDGVRLTQGFLIAGRVNNETQNGAVRVENCEFRDWATQNETGRLIQTHSDICPAGQENGAPVTVESVVISNCRGIEQIKQEGCAGESFAMTDHAKFIALMKRARKRQGLDEESEPEKEAEKQPKEPAEPKPEPTTDSIIHVSRGKGKEKLWEEACRHLEKTLPKDIFEKWIAVIQCRSIEANKVLLVVGNDFHQSWIEDHYLPLIRKALAVVSGIEFQIDLAVDDSLPGEPLEGGKEKLFFDSHRAFEMRI